MKLKNNKSALKRIKIKKTLLYRKKAYKNHLLRKKTSKRLRNLSKSQVIDNSNKKSFLNALQDIQKLEREPFKVNCNKMLADFDRNNIAENLIKFIV